MIDTSRNDRSKPSLVTTTNGTTAENALAAVAVKALSPPRIEQQHNVPYLLLQTVVVFTCMIQSGTLEVPARVIVHKGLG